MARVQGLDYVEFVGTGTVATAILFASVFATMFGTFVKREYQRTYDAILAAATLSDRYITDRQLPDKAIDLMDEAASRIRMEVESKPEEIESLDRRILRLKIEREGLRRETDAASVDRLQTLEGELANLEQQSAELTTRWQAEKDKIAGEAKLKEQLDAARIQPVTRMDVSGDASGAIRTRRPVFFGTERGFLDVPVYNFGASADFTHCQPWRDDVRRYMVEQGVDVVVMSQYQRLAEASTHDPIPLERWQALLPPLLDSLRAEPRFQAVVRERGAPA
mgnify:CR=1 FL=1